MKSKWKIFSSSFCFFVLATEEDAEDLRLKRALNYRLPTNKELIVDFEDNDFTEI